MRRGDLAFLIRLPPRCTPMPRTLPSTPPASAPHAQANGAGLYSTLINRRVSIRYPGGLATVASAAMQTASRFRKARIIDVSQGGIALVLRRQPKIGDFIVLQLTNRILQFTFDIAAEVRHV